MRELIEKILRSRKLKKLIKYEGYQKPRKALYSETKRSLSPPLLSALVESGIKNLYAHQAKAIDSFQEGKNVMVVTPTASGKSLIYYLPTFEIYFQDPQAKALYLFPYKALEQDQLKNLRALASKISKNWDFQAEIYDGDTSAYKRKKIKANLPSVIITNPDMLHMGILAFHPDWQHFFENLKLVVLDELHVYRGIFGTHLHHIMKRLKRICRHYGSEPKFIVSSATIANPDEFSSNLTGINFQIIRENGAPAAGKRFLFVNPDVSPYTVAAHLFEISVRSGYKTIAFTKARKITELLYSWLITSSPDIKDRISSYRAGYLPEERREIESKLFRGELMGVISTSALEHGIDVGGLDVCLLVGYPGSIISSWQRIGRVGRSDRESLVILIALPDALDQYFMRRPEEFFGRSYEKAVVDPVNRFIMSEHVVCAGAEIPLDESDKQTYETYHPGLLMDLIQRGKIVEGAEGDRWFSLKRNPQREISLRSMGEGYRILEKKSQKEIGSIDGVRVFHECHEGAIYLHQGIQYKILALDQEAKRVEAVPVDVNYYTQVFSHKETIVLETMEQAAKERYKVAFGRLKVTEKIMEYARRRIFGQEILSKHPLNIPPITFETMGLWIELPKILDAESISRSLHFMGGLHAVEHAAIALFPLLTICDRDDVGGIAYQLHPQLQGPAIFIYDGYPGGIGLAAKGFQDIERLLEKTYQLISLCECQDGCPSCIHSPKCGSANRPLDKSAALFLLGFLVGRSSSLGKEVSMNDQRSLFDTESPKLMEKESQGRGRNDQKVLFFDVETRKSASDVGGWNNISKMGLALGVIYDLQKDEYRTYFEEDLDRLLIDLLTADLVVGFNIDRFDIEVLRGYTDKDLSKIKTLDMLKHISNKLGFRLSLGHLAEATLGEKKIANGMQSLQWFKEGRLDLIEKYCRKDVEITKRLYEFGKGKGYILYRDIEGRLVKLNVHW